MMGSGWREAWIRRRNGWLSSPAFQRFAWKFAPFRPIARRRSAALFGLVTGFTFSQLVAAGVFLGLFRRLQESPSTAEEIAAEAGLPIDSARDLLEGLASIGMAECLGHGRYTLGVHGAAFVADPGLEAMVRHNQLFYADLADPLVLLRSRGGGMVAAYWPYAEDRPDGEVGAYSQLMAASQPAVAETVLDTFDFRGVQTLLDVGGGEGAFLEAVHARHPAIALKLFDLPAVAERARGRIGSFATVHAGHMGVDALPSGADCISFVRVLHDHDDDFVEPLLRAAHCALSPGGRVLIAEPMCGEGGAGPLGDVYFRLYMRAMGRGRPRSPGELCSMLRQAGFRDVRQLVGRNPWAAQLVIGQRG
jgi:demethylspheroidene O-methyltransferase